jgi:hypothetical protein
MSLLELQEILLLWTGLGLRRGLGETRLGGARRPMSPPRRSLSLSAAEEGAGEVGEHGGVAGAGVGRRVRTVPT